ncbi:MAG: glycosyltransferase [Candidatus Peregrinibacteria bacterium]|nr:glycosyltransferase [Candidatus Peregrinibacteria bacterium]MDZ4245113.1 glycosyltransferase [Candidatus Gracilibacteria bacterium]
MVKIIDIRALQGAGRSGVPVYIEGFLYDLFIEKKENEQSPIILWINSAKDIVLPNFIDDYIHLPNVCLVHTKVPNKILNVCCSLFRRPRIDRLRGLRNVLRGFDDDVEFIVLDPRPAPVSNKVKKTIVVHDLSPIKFPHFFSLKSKLWFLFLRLRKELKEAYKIYAVSQFTESEIKGLDSSLRDKITVQYPITLLNDSRVHLSEEFLTEILEKYKIPNQPFLFTISTLEPRKNIETLIKKFLNGDFPKYEYLVISGKKNERIFDTIKYRTHPSIIFTGFISEEEKLAFYNLASGFACLSHYEGYGIPIRDAMNFKLPLILSDIPVFHEITQGYDDLTWVQL